MIDLFCSSCAQPGRVEPLLQPLADAQDRDRWMGGRPVLRHGETVLTGTALTSDPQLWPLEHDYYAQPYFNEFEWERHHAHECDLTWHPDCGDSECIDCHDAGHPRPHTPPLWHWLEVYFDLTDELIASHISGRWLSLADWKADMDQALDRQPFSVRRAVFHLWSGYGLSDVARMDFGGDQVQALKALRAASSALRKATELNLKLGYYNSDRKDPNAIQRPGETTDSGAGGGNAPSPASALVVAVGPDHLPALAAAGAAAGGGG